MNEEEIQILAERGTFLDRPIKGELIETHISWIILSGDYAFKIKKPLKLSFLDFSGLEQRKINCKREIQLNSRYSAIYLGVEAVYRNNGKWQIGGEDGEIVDYAVKMERMDGELKMDVLLRKKAINPEQITKLAKKVAQIHLQAPVIRQPFDLVFAKNTFNDVLVLKSIISEDGGKSMLQKAVEWSDHLLAKHAGRLQERVDLGLKRDVHGDLHTGNIFISDVPVIFDCIEFNEDFRQIDVLYEVAFLCMDLEAVDRGDLAMLFLHQYSGDFQAFIKPEDAEIFNYYKCLRANIRAKVHGLSAEQSNTKLEKKSHMDEVKKYLRMMKNYMDNM